MRTIYDNGDDTATLDDGTVVVIHGTRLTGGFAVVVLEPNRPWVLGCSRTAASAVRRANKLRSKARSFMPPEVIVFELVAAPIGGCTPTR